MVISFSSIIISVTTVSKSNKNRKMKEEYNKQRKEKREYGQSSCRNLLKEEKEKRREH